MYKFNIIAKKVYYNLNYLTIYIKKIVTLINL